MVRSETKDEKPQNISTAEIPAGAGISFINLLIPSTIHPVKVIFPFFRNFTDCILIFLSLTLPAIKPRKRKPRPAVSRLAVPKSITTQ